VSRAIMRIETTDDDVRVRVDYSTMTIEDAEQMVRDLQDQIAKAKEIRTVLTSMKGKR